MIDLQIPPMIQVGKHQQTLTVIVEEHTGGIVITLYRPPTKHTGIRSSAAIFSKETTQEDFDQELEEMARTMAVLLDADVEYDLKRRGYRT